MPSVDFSVGRTIFTEVLPVTPKTTKITAASVGLSLHEGRCCVVHFQNCAYHPPLLLLEAACLELLTDSINSSMCCCLGMRKLPTLRVRVPPGGSLSQTLRFSSVQRRAITRTAGSMRRTRLRAAQGTRMRALLGQMPWQRAYRRASPTVVTWDFRPTNRSRGDRRNCRYRH